MTLRFINPQILEEINEKLIVLSKRKSFFSHWLQALHEHSIEKEATIHSFKIESASESYLTGRRPEDVKKGVRNLKDALQWVPIVHNAQKVTQWELSVWNTNMGAEYNISADISGSIIKTTKYYEQNLPQIVSNLTFTNPISLTSGSATFDYASQAVQQSEFVDNTRAQFLLDEYQKMRREESLIEYVGQKLQLVDPSLKLKITFDEAVKICKSAIMSVADRK